MATVAATPVYPVVDSDSKVRETVRKIRAGWSQGERKRRAAMGRERREELFSLLLGEAQLCR